jgi:hypothetical protein
LQIEELDALDSNSVAKKHIYISRRWKKYRRIRNNETYKQYKHSYTANE